MQLSHCELRGHRWSQKTTLPSTYPWPPCRASQVGKTAALEPPSVFSACWRSLSVQMAALYVAHAGLLVCWPALNSTAAGQATALGQQAVRGPAQRPLGVSHFQPVSPAAGVKGQAWATYLPAEQPPADGGKPRGATIFARDFQTVVLYDGKGEFVGVRRPGSTTPISAVSACSCLLSLTCAAGCQHCSCAVCMQLATAGCCAHLN